VQIEQDIEMCAQVSEPDLPPHRRGVPGG
jgi:hypothetical protein